MRCFPFISLILCWLSLVDDARVFHGWPVIGFHEAFVSCEYCHAYIVGVVRAEKERERELPAMYGLEGVKKQNSWMENCHTEMTIMMMM